MTDSTPKKEGTPTLQAFIDYRNGDITFRDYLTILLLRCAIVREERTESGKRRDRRSLAEPPSGGGAPGH